MKLCLSLIFLGFLLNLSLQEDQTRLDEEWELFKTTCNKAYATPEEEAIRKQNFIDSWNKVASNNNLFEENRRNFLMKIYCEADLSSDEFIELKTVPLANFEDTNVDTITTPQSDSSSNPPTFFDWNAQGKVTSVKNQGTCNSFWAHAALSVIESQLIIKGVSISNLDLSEQQMIDCADKTLQSGCSFGGPMNLLRELKNKNVGVAGENSYPYEAKQRVCRRNLYKENYYVKNHDLYYTTTAAEDKMLQALLTKGPLLFGIYASENFLHYKSGVFDTDAECKPNRLPNFVITLTGYGETADGVKYWIARNSWGTKWGENGYIRILRGSNFCRAGNYFGYPILDF